MYRAHLELDGGAGDISQRIGRASRRGVCPLRRRHRRRPGVDGRTRGQIRGLIGPNGAGKTTLFDTITGMRAPSSGKVHYAGADITTKTAVWRSRNGIRRTFQRQQPFGWLSVEDNVLAALDYHGGGGGIVADIVRASPRGGAARANGGPRPVM